MGEASVGTTVSLLPHQSTFVEAVLGAAGRRVTILHGQVGLGKGTALVALAGRILLQNPRARVLLFAAPAALRDQFAERLRQLGTPRVVVDRYYFRKLLDGSKPMEFWPHGSVMILSPEFARQRDVRESLLATKWDLVIADEIPMQEGGSNADLLRAIAESAGRVVLSTTAHLALPGWSAPNEIMQVEWSWDTILNRDGTRFELPNLLRLNEISYNLSPVELKLAGMVEGLARELEGSPESARIGGLFRQGSQSSAAALERMMEAPATEIEPQEAATSDTGIAPDELAEDQARQSGGFPSPAAAVMIEQLRQTIDAVEEDSKLSALVRLLDHLARPTDQPARICVVSHYVATHFYIAAEIERHGHKSLIFNSMTSADTRSENLERFMSEGGILIAGHSFMASGLDLKGITELVFFDIPSSQDTLYRILGRIDRFGSISPLTIHVLIPAEVSPGVAVPGLAALRAIAGR